MPAEGWGYRIILALSGITLILVIVYLLVSQQNRAVQAKINERQQFINQSIQFAHINETLVRIMATVAVSEKDDKLRDLLTQNGIKINPPAAAKAATSAAPLAPAAPKP
jgi:predicted Holliday junction resolvase-like endonuclease